MAWDNQALTEPTWPKRVLHDSLRARLDYLHFPERLYCILCVLVPKVVQR